ncbi:MAG TPA: phosphate ABC transporter substrate-binding protein PstS [Gemmatimonadales bacterium]|nr:phosphate ABC transporter substrate-binding protein PstS [Gemmatimonadales bacterium]
MTRVPLVRGVTLVLFLPAACGGGDRPAPSGGAGRTAAGAALTGAGATFPNPIYAKWFDLYAKQTGVRINYQSIGSGGGIRQFIEGTVDFGATDGPMSDEQIRQAQDNVVHLPTVLGAVVLTYNLLSLKTTRLKLDAPTVAAIFLGRITKWSAPEIAALNPGVALPDADLVVVHRSDGSGTTYIFTDYLAKVSPEWAQGPGRGTSVNWPAGLGGKGNEGVTQQVKQTDGALGYVELVYATANSLPYAVLRNAAGRDVEPTLAAVTAAAGSAQLGPSTDFRVSVTNAPGADAYPIASFTWLLVHPRPPDPAKAKLLKGFLTWMLTPEAQQATTDLGYAPLPAGVMEILRTRIAALPGP